MGLDWNPGPKAKPGHEQEFLQLWDKHHHPGWFQSKSSREKVAQRFREITQPAFETLKTPRVGFDEKATEWARLDAFPRRADKNVTEEVFLNGMRGFYVLDLVSPCDGLPRYTNGQPGGYVEQYSFRGQFLKDSKDIIGRDLLGSAYDSKLAEDTIIYGDKLLEACSRFAAAKNIELQKINAPEDPDTVEFHLDVVRSAGLWCKFWGSKGHWLEAFS